MLKKMLKKIRTFFYNAADRYSISRAKCYEIKKFKDSRRVGIYSSVQLTKEQIKAIDDLYINNYGKKIPYTWHRHYTAFTGKFDAGYFPELLYIPVFERLMTPEKSFSISLSDKNILSIFARGAGVKMPKDFLHCACGIFTDGNMNNVSISQAKEIMWNIGECFIKPTVDTSSGDGCFVACFKDGIDILGGHSVEEIISGAIGDNYIIQERVKCHNSIATIYSESVNTLRMVSYWWKGKLHYFPVVLRIGRGGSYLDNAHAGGLFVAVDDDGTLHRSAYTEFREEFLEHPDTKQKFDGLKIENIYKVFNAIEKMHACIPQVGVVNWDFTIDQLGDPVMIEANMYDGKNGGGVWIMQMAHGLGPFKENLPEVLKWLAFMEKLPKSKRKNYGFGEFIEKK